jgi:predicted membrane-bound spermidine synthase
MTRFQILQSYYQKVLIEKVKSNFGFMLELYLVRNQLLLETPNAAYSFGTSYTAVALPLRDLGIQDYNIDNGLIIGLGMGSVVEILEHYFPDKKLKFDAVELDSEVVYLYEKYQKPNSEVVIYNESAVDFLLKKKTKKYDFIMSDVFVDDVTPEHFLSVHYYKSLMEMLHPKGLLMINHFNKNGINTDDLFKLDALESELYSFKVLNYNTTQILVFEKK